MKKQSNILIGITAGVLLVAVVVIITVIAASGSDSRNYAKHMESAQRYMDELQYEQAIAEYKAAIAIEPNNAEAYRALAEVYVELEDYESAAAILAHGIRKNGNEDLVNYLAEIQEAWEEKQVLAAGAQDGSQKPGVTLGDAQKESQEPVEESHSGNNGLAEAELTAVPTPSSAPEQSQAPTSVPTSAPLIFPEIPAILPSGPITFSLPEKDSEEIIMFESALDCSAVEVSVFNEEDSFEANVSYYIGYIQADGTVKMVGNLGVTSYTSYSFNKNCTKTFYLEQTGQYGIYIKNAISYNPYYYSGTNRNELQLTYKVIPGDKNEPNSTREMAARLEEGEYCFFNLLGEKDEDYFVLQLTESFDKIEISIISETGKFDSPIVYRVDQYDEESGDMISVGSVWGSYASGATQYDTTKTYVIDGPGTYYIMVTNASNANYIYYSGDNKSYLAIMCRGINDDKEGNGL